MNKFKLVVKTETPVIQGKCNTYCVVITYMHGDADHYTKQTFNFPVGDINHKGISIQDIIYIINEWSKIGWNKRCDLLCSSGQLQDWFIGIGYPDSDVVHDIFEHDVTNHNTLAHIDDCNISWFDHSGIEHDVVVIDIDTNEEIKIY